MVTLYYFESPDLTISMRLYFNDKDQLFFDGNDNGKTVEKYWGDYDYEYTYTIEPEEVNKLYEIFNLEPGDKIGLLQALKNRFSDDKAYSLFGKFMTDHHIKYEGFTWA